MTAKASICKTKLNLAVHMNLVQMAIWLSGKLDILIMGFH